MNCDEITRFIWKTKKTQKQNEWKFSFKATGLGLINWHFHKKKSEYEN